MAKKKTKHKAVKKSASHAVKYVVVSSRGYGNALKGTKITMKERNQKALKRTAPYPLASTFSKP